MNTPYRALFTALALSLSVAHCAAEPGLEDPDTGDIGTVTDEVSANTRERFIAAYDGTVGSLTHLVLTDTQLSPTTWRYFGSAQVQCIQAPCPAVRAEGSYRVTSRYLYLSVDGATQRYSHTLRNDTLTLRQGSRVTHAFTRAVSFCGQVSDCGEQRLSLPRCVGYMTCTTENRCNFRCGSPVNQECSANNDCASGYFCSGTTCGGAGRCAVQPGACTAQYTPVCGCDGRTYGNGCTAASAGVRVVSQGECAPAPRTCRANSDCGATEMCQTTTCNGAGTCRSVGVRCSNESIPVCGCDGRTYTNACQALTARVNVAYNTACR
ncbi:MAG: Kazal-type serine protease inhibitor domain-containing protein [Deltaproteobacteria bacterium]|nr:Kazal-type serine protease inhibitor domain-containing protein [Deltaproteobacteria bacterium]